MSTRAIRALRGDDTSQLLGGGADDEDNSDTDDDASSSVEQPTRSAFAFLGESDDESSSSSEEEEDASHRSPTQEQEDRRTTPASTTAPRVPTEEVEDDIDALLEEFQTQDAENELMVAEGLLAETTTLEASPLDAILLHAFDCRDLDHDFSMRVSLLHETGTSRRKSLSFGSPRDGWVRPPRLVGGGMGMKTYADYHEQEDEPPSVPWPYNSQKQENGEATYPPSRWFTFVHSEQNQRDRDDFTDVIQSSGDLNALGMFLAHHPYVTSALLQYSSVLYQSNRSNDGLALLRRCLWIYEVSMLMGFRDRIATGHCCCFMDSGREENVDFFESLFQLFRASYIAGMSRTAFAVCRLTLSLDPLRDPKNALLSLDAQALAVALGSNLPEQKATLQWFVDLVASNALELCYDEGEDAQFRGKLQDLPNIAYSYALCLFLLGRTASLEGEEATSNQLAAQAKTALLDAIARFPLVVPQLLENLEIDTAARSFQRDWLSVLDFTATQAKTLSETWFSQTEDYVSMSRLLQTVDRIIRVFAMQNAAHWSDETVLQWLFDTLHALCSEKKDGRPGGVSPLPPSFALLRYANVQSSWYNTRIDLLPDDVNLLDPNVVAQAMAVQPGGRPRFLRDHHNAALRRQQQQGLFAATQQQQRLDPDAPMLEVFLRSFLPWNQVDGLPPARR